MRFDTVVLVSTHGSFQLTDEGDVIEHRIDEEGVHESSTQGADPLWVNVLEVPFGKYFYSYTNPELDRKLARKYADKIKEMIVDGEINVKSVRSLLKHRASHSMKAHAFKSQNHPYFDMKTYSIDINKEPEEGIDVLWSDVPGITPGDMWHEAARKRSTLRSFPWREATRTAVLKNLYDKGARDVLLIDLSCAADFGVEHSLRTTRAVRRSMLKRRTKKRAIV